MASFLNELSLAIGLLASDHSSVADINGWRDYVWTIKPIEQCLDRDAQGFCHAVNGRWDWKRAQFYDFSHRIDRSGNTITVRLTLTNKDPDDRDDVCVTALFTDREGAEIAVFHQAWRSLPGRTIDRQIPLRPALKVAEIASVVVGSKQCREGVQQDQKLFLALRRRLGQK